MDKSKGGVDLTVSGARWTGSFFTSVLCMATLVGGPTTLNGSPAFGGIF